MVKQFAGRLVLNGVSLAIPPGETAALIGPSGGGKSTFLRCINGLTAFDQGTIQVGTLHLEPWQMQRPESVAQIRRLFGMIFQDFQLFPHLTALGNVIEAPLHVLQLPRKARERGMQLLERVGLADRADAYPRELSGGQKQRVAIARGWPWSHADCFATRSPARWIPN